MHMAVISSLCDEYSPMRVCALFCMGCDSGCVQRLGGHVAASSVYKACVYGLQACGVLCALSMASSEAGPALCVVGVLCAGNCSHITQCSSGRW